MHHVRGYTLTRTRFHPAIQRVKEIIDSGELGSIKEMHVSLCYPKGIITDGDIRLNYGIGGGALMDAGCKSWPFLMLHLYKLDFKVIHSIVFAILHLMTQRPSSLQKP